MPLHAFTLTSRQPEAHRNDRHGTALSMGGAKSLPSLIHRRTEQYGNDHGTTRPGHLVPPT